MASVHKDERVADILMYELRARYPQTTLPTRSGRLLEAAERIAAPIKSSKERFESNAAREQYLKKEWIPKVRINLETKGE